MASKDQRQVINFKGDENEVRGNWGNKADFILSTLGYAVGLGNVWRFPYLAYESGGGAFLIPYAVMLFFAGLPIFFLEVSFGQYCSEGPIQAWKAVPMMRGIGYGMIVTSAVVGISYIVVITYCLRYLIASFTTRLPWVGCDNDWNTKFCSSKFVDCKSDGLVFLANGTCVSPDILTVSERIDYGVVTLPFGNYSVGNITDPLATERVRPSEEYWNFEIRREASSIGETGGIVWQLALCLATVWIMVFVAQIKGIKSSGKVVYVTATFPYVVLLILLILGLTLPGHKEGIKFFISPDWDKVTDPQIWLAAATQIFYSLSAAWGGLITLASYNKFHNNCYSDSMFVAIANCATSILAGFVIFSIVGFMAHELNQEIDEVVDQGYGLAFIAYPEAVARLPGAPIWSTLFFLMLVTLGLDSQFVNVETVVTAIVDEYPEKLRPRKTMVLAVVCSVGFLVGLLCVTEAGPYWADLFDLYGASFNLLIFGFFECIALTWLYGVKRLRNDIRSMIGDGPVDFPLFHWWTLMWSAISPAVLLFVLIYNWTNWADPSHNGPYPGWARAIGWMITMTTLIWIPVFCIYEFLSARGTFYERWQAISNPGPDWGPAVQKFREDAWGIHLQHGTTMGGDLILRITVTIPM
ncbi:putative sodium- and chloride-dependent neutral and basic amino acid transporter B(0+) isoform X1 [Apostichopus japonicus]|uniref:Transporter n=1 Tax=Stichopus japonicus TaxID=307972 RepID=A0A2G8KGK7_STIJA|nr:putative sodium- and chloride-dependent neutral and basic amino acid transporter B(0+) isoform X1 [Apostichopus japonicus]